MKSKWQKLLSKGNSLSKGGSAQSIATDFRAMLEGQGKKILAFQVEPSWLAGIE